MWIERGKAREKKNEMRDNDIISLFNGISTFEGNLIPKP